jgi:hypothetical protein
MKMTGSTFIAQLPPAASVMDASKYQDYMRCFRYGFYSHLLGWRSEEPNLHLIFGDAAHAGKEQFRLLGYDHPEAVDAAISAFEERYDAVYGQDLNAEDLNRPKNKEGFITAITEHQRRFAEERRDWDLLFTEVGFSLPLTDELTYNGRLDAVYAVPDKGIVIVDDKYSGWDNEAAIEQWYLSFQMRGYLNAALEHAAVDKPLWSEDEVWGMIVDTTILKNPVKLKKDGTPYANQRNLEYDEYGVPFRHRHIPLEIPLSRTSIDSWLFEVQYYSELLTQNFALLSEAKESDEVLHCFPRCPTSCIMFNRPCKFFDICHAVENPLRLVDKTPVGFKQEYWNPTEREIKQDIGELQK